MRVSMAIGAGMRWTVEIMDGRKVGRLRFGIRRPLVDGAVRMAVDGGLVGMVGSVDGKRVRRPGFRIS